jgi:phosphoglycerate dehydrogenase-like enzyme
MVAKPFKVYVIQGRNQRDYSACQAALATVPAHLEALPFLKQEEDLIAHAHDADGLIVSSSPITRRVMSALTNL